MKNLIMTLAALLFSVSFLVLIKYTAAMCRINDWTDQDRKHFWKLALAIVFGLIAMGISGYFLLFNHF